MSQTKALWAGMVGYFGCLAIIITDATTVLLVDELSFISDTISNAAAGKHAWIQDLGLCLFATSLAAIAYGIWRTGAPGWRNMTSVVSLIVVACALALLALNNEYGDDQSGGFVFHIELVYIIGSVMLIPMALMASNFRELSGKGPAIAWVVFTLWLVGGPLLFEIPSEWRGLYERGIAGLLLIWALIASSLIVQRSTSLRQR